MKVCVLAPSPNPFMLGGAEKFLLGLTRAINRYTAHEAELLKIPVRDWEFWGLIGGYQQFSKLDLSYFDMVITTKYPAWMVSHRNHHLYMQHKCRGLYDLYHLSGSGEELPSHPSLDKLYSMLNGPREREILEGLFDELFKLKEKLPPHIFSFPGPLTRRIVRFLDEIALSPGEIKSYSAISRNVAERKDYFPPGVEIRVIHHPSDLEGFYSSSHSYIFTASRMEDLKRIHLLIEAYKRVDSDMEFLIAGTGGQEEKYRKLAEPDSRIKMLGFVSDKALLAHYASALFVPFIPYDEDYGLITLEAMLSSKAVLTADDSGGPKELVTHMSTGLIVRPEIGELRDAMEYLIRNRERTIEMGKKAKEAASHITWENTVKKLFEERKIIYVKKKGKEKIVVTTTFSVYPPIQGGQKRIFNLWKSLGKEFEILLLNIGYEDKEVEIAENFREIVISRSERHLKNEEKLAKLLGHPAGDVSLIEGYKDNPRYVDLLSRETKDASCVVLSHPYLFYALRDVYSGHVAYEAHNCEYDMKSALFSGERKEEYVGLVKRIEKDLCDEALFIISVSEEDRKRLVELYSIPEEKITVIENGADFSRAKRLTDYEKVTIRERLGIPKVPVGVFMGSYHGPNIEALEKIEDMSDKLPDILFLVFGSVCEKGLSKSPPNLKLLGLLSEEEKDILLSICDFALNPIESGSGSNLKLIEYIAFFLPVITTPFGIRGFDFDSNCLFVSDIKDFPEKIREVLSLGNLEKMLENTWSVAKSRYDWKSLSERLSIFLKKSLKNL